MFITDAPHDDRCSNDSSPPEMLSHFSRSVSFWNRYVGISNNRNAKRTHCVAWNQSATLDMQVLCSLQYAFIVLILVNMLTILWNTMEPYSTDYIAIRKVYLTFWMGMYVISTLGQMVFWPSTSLAKLYIQLDKQSLINVRGYVCPYGSTYFTKK